MSQKIIRAASLGDFYVDVRYKRTNRHNTKIFTVKARPADGAFFVDVGEFHILEGDRVKYVSKPKVLELISKKIQWVYRLDDLLELVPH